MKLENGMIIAVLGVVLIIAFLMPSSIAVEEKSSDRIISVSGTGSVMVAPDEGHLLIAVVSEAETASKAGEMNAETMTSVQDALKEAGVSEDNIETKSYSIYPNYEWVDTSSSTSISTPPPSRVLVGYTATNMIEVVCSPDNVGDVIDAALSGGANRIDSVTFQLSDDLRRDAYAKALREAILDARTKASVVVDELNVGGVQLASVSVGNYYSSSPMRMEYTDEKGIGMSATTPVTPSDIEVSASVSLDYSFTMATPSDRGISLLD